MTLYTQVSANRYKTWAYLLVYVILLLAVGAAASYYFDSPLIFIFAAVISIVQGIASYRYSDSIALTVSGAQPLDPERYREVYRLVENLSITAGLPMPRLYLLNDTALNAFATGRDPQHAALALTQGLIERLDRNELEGVIAHELSHIGNEDIRLMSMVMVMAGLIALLSDWMLRSWFFGSRRRDDNHGSGSPYLLVIMLALSVLAPIAATLIQLAISRKREYMADANGVLLTRYPEGLVGALEKIGADREPLEVANRATAHMYINNPLRGGFFTEIFSTHPPIEKRIEALKRGGGMVAG
jgi:heat shock protein HtpX